jgi:acyl-CoA synthetase (AMP-forming)/AMP-acid ligase II
MPSSPSAASPRPGIAARFAEAAARHAEFPALVLPQGHLSYRELWRITLTFAQRLQALGVDRHSIVALNTTDPLASVAMLMATALLGCQLVIAGPNLARTKALAPTHFLRTPEMEEGRRRTYALIDAAWLPPPEAGAGSDPDAFDLAGFDPVDPEAPWLAQHTSGTTGTPKYLSLSQRVVLDRTAAIAGDFPAGATTLATLFTCTSRPFQARAIGALLNGCTIVTGTDIAEWRRWGVDYVCASPLQAAQVFRALAPEGKFQRIETSGGRLSDPDARVLFDHFRTVIDIYGASETNKSFATLVTPGPDGTVLRSGRPLDSEVQIIDRAGQPCPVGVVGTVRVRNGYLAPGYIGKPDETARAFRDGWFYPGDIGHWTETGALEILGREDDLMSIGGVKVYATLIDLMISVVPGVEEAICFKNPKAGAAEELLAFVKFAPLVDRGDCVERIRQAITDKFGVMLPIRNIHPIDAVPRNENGKPLREVAQKLVLAEVAARAEAHAAARAAERERA